MKKVSVGLVDCNNFFVSCERLFRPDLLNHPTLVLSSNDGCVVARSQEVKDIGIPMGVPYFKIKDIIKDKGIQTFSGNLTLYRDISRRVFDIVRDEFSVVEQYSVDEAFFLIENNNETLSSLKNVRDRVLREVGVPVSLGVASSKTLAKISTDLAKKASGVNVLQESGWVALSEDLQLSTVWGVGRQLAQKFAQDDLKSVADFCNTDKAIIQQIYGVVGARLHAELLGEYIHQVGSKRPLQKSLMSTRSFSKSTENKDIILDALAHHARSVALDLRAMNAKSAVVRVSLKTSRHGDFFLRGGTKELVLQHSTNDTFEIIKAAETLFIELYESEVPYQSVGVIVSGIQSTDLTQNSLFLKDLPNDNDPLFAALDKLNKNADRELVQVGSRLKQPLWQSKSAARSNSYTTQWSEVPVVTAS